MKRPIEAFIVTLFEHGLEMFDRLNRQAINLGGAKLWRVDHLGTGECQVQFNNRKLEALIRRLPVLLYTTSRVDTKTDGSFDKIQGKPKRICNALTLYCQYDQAPEVKAHIIQELPELEGFVGTGSEFGHLIPDGISEIQVPNWYNTIEPMQKERLVFIAVKSGKPNSLDFWFNRPSSMQRPQQSM